MKYNNPDNPENMEDLNMSDAIGTGQAGTYALLLDTLRAGRGGGGYYGGGEGGGYGVGAFAGPASNAVRIDQVGEQVAGQSDCTRKVIGAGLDTTTNTLETLIRENQFNNVTAQMSDLGRDLKNNEISAINAAHDNAMALAKCCCETQLSIKDVQASMADCCCETQKLVIAENQKTRDLINENALRSAIDTNNINATVGAINQNANSNTAAIIAAIREGHHHRR